MRIFIGKLCVFVLLINFFCFPSTQHTTENITNSRIVLANSLTPPDLSMATPQGQDSKDLARWDIYEFRGKGTILGQFEDIQFKNISFALKPDDRIVLYTDGIVETSNPTHTLFGFERVKEFIASYAPLPAGQFADELIRQLFNWSGKPSEEALDDDLTLIVADYQHV